MTAEAALLLRVLLLCKATITSSTSDTQPPSTPRPCLMSDGAQQNRHSRAQGEGRGAPATLPRSVAGDMSVLRKVPPPSGHAPSTHTAAQPRRPAALVCTAWTMPLSWFSCVRTARGCRAGWCGPAPQRARFSSGPRRRAAGFMRPASCAFGLKATKPSSAWRGCATSVTRWCMWWPTCMCHLRRPRRRARSTREAAAWRLFRGYAAVCAGCSVWRALSLR